MTETLTSAKPALERYAEIFKALSHPHRLDIFIRLTQCCVPGTRVSGEQAETTCVGDLGRHLNIAPSTVSHHLKELVRAGLIRNQRRGQTIECWVEPEVLRELSTFFDLSSGGGCGPTCGVPAGTAKAPAAQDSPQSLQPE